MDYVFGIVQALVIVGIVWVRLTDLGKRVDKLENRFNEFVNHLARRGGK